MQYQLCISGEFTISRNKENNEINNELFASIGLQYVSSHRLDFDGGIQILLLAIDELGKIFTSHSVDCVLYANIYNLDEDGTELEAYLIKDRDDCDCFSVKKNIETNELEAFTKKLENYWSSDSIGSLRSFCALKLGY